MMEKSFVKRFKIWPEIQSMHFKKISIDGHTTIGREKMNWTMDDSSKHSFDIKIKFEKKGWNVNSVFTCCAELVPHSEASYR